MDVEGYYQRYWQSGGGCTPGRLASDLESLYARYVSPNCNFLDVGCGDGRTSGPWLRERGCSYAGVDVSSTAVAQARSLGLDARLVTDAASLPFDDDEFDCAGCIEVLEHLFDPISTVREVHRVLRPDGVFIVTVPNAAYWRRRADLLIGHWNPLGDELSAQEPWRAPHIRFFSARLLGRMLRHAGFNDIQLSGHGGAVLGDIPYFRRYFRSDPRLYGRLRDRFPSLLAYTLSAVARKAS
ncbi:MAG TPA: class I SAM-dependent methyltransferase [Solirubrobacteraceae bacterium]|nr:class I SAM-dependent methyltransferase [Solirubrobacteraceae bacterium]